MSDAGSGMTTASVAGKPAEGAHATPASSGPGTASTAPSKAAADEQPAAAKADKAKPVVCANCGESPWDDASTTFPPPEEHATPCIWCGKDPRGLEARPDPLGIRRQPLAD